MFVLSAGWSQASAQVTQTTFEQDKALKANQITAGSVIAFKGISETNSQWVNWGTGSSTTLFYNGVYTVENGTESNTYILKRKSDGKYISQGTTAQNGGYKITFVSDATQAAAFTISQPALNDQNAEGGVSGIHEVVLPDMTGKPNGEMTFEQKTAILKTSWAYDYQVRFTTGGNYLNIQTAGTGTPKLASGKGSWSIVMVYDASEYKEPYRVTTKKLDDKGNLLDSQNSYMYQGTTVDLTTPTINSYYTATGTVKVDGNVTTDASINISKATTIEYVYKWNTDPIEYSNITNGTFPADTKWYLMRLRDSYVSYNSNTPEYLPGTGNKTHDDAYWWAFGKDADGNIKVYNKAAGATQVMTSVSPKDAESSTYPHFEQEDGLEDTKNTAWTIYPSINYGSDNGFYLSRVGETTKINYQNNKLAYWAGQDIGSTFRITPLEDEIQALKASYEEGAKRGAIGSLNEDDMDALDVELKKGTIEGLRTAVTVAENAEKIPFKPELYYRIENLARKYSTKNGTNLNNGGYLEPVDYLETPNFLKTNGYFSNDRNASRAQAIWKFESNGTDGQYYLHNMNADTYMSGNDGAYFAPGVAGTESATAFTLEALSLAQYNIKKAGSGQRLHASGAGETNGASIMFYDSGDLNSPSAWYLVPATSIDVTISDAGYATVNYPFAVQVTDGVTAYIGTANAQEGVFTLKKIENGIIPANTPVVLEGAAKTYSLTILADNDDEPLTGNDLSGSTVFKTIDTAADAYILGNGEKEVGFYLMDETDRTLGANKAYIELEAAANPIRSIIIGGPTTGIEDTVAEGAEAEEYYDLQGRRVLNPTKGIYVTKSGKKVLFNK